MVSGSSGAVADLALSKPHRLAREAGIRNDRAKGGQIGRSTVELIGRPDCCPQGGTWSL